jgi:hypothetical protein
MNRERYNQYQKLYQREYRKRKKHDLKYRAQRRKWNKNFRLKYRDSEAFREKCNKANAKYHRKPGVGTRVRRWMDDFIAKHPERYKTYMVFHNAVAAGKIKRPSCCESCGINPGRGVDGRSLLQAHHEDYSKPFKVEWLCAPCHGKTRRKV